MIRRLVITGLAAVLAAPIFVSVPASATVLFTCNTVYGDGDVVNYSYAQITPGLSHTQTAQDLQAVVIVRDCSNGRYFSLYFGGESVAPVTTYPPRPLACPVAWGGAGPDYLDRTPIFLGGDPPPKADSSLYVYWGPVTDRSRGAAKIKQGASDGQWRLVMVINSGLYAPPAGQKTKIKGPISFAPDPQTSYTCADDSDPLERVLFSTAGTLVASQK
jgi:hypothetical protein